MWKSVHMCYVLKCGAGCSCLLCVYVQHSHWFIFRQRNACKLRGTGQVVDLELPAHELLQHFMCGRARETPVYPL